MSGEDRIAAAYGEGQIDDVAETHVVQDREGGAFSVVELAVQVAFLLQNLDAGRIEPVEDVRSADNTEMMQGECLVTRIEGKGDLGSVLTAAVRDDLVGPAEVTFLRGDTRLLIEQEKVLPRGILLRRAGRGNLRRLHPGRRRGDGKSSIGRQIRGGTERSGQRDRAEEEPTQGEAHAGGRLQIPCVRVEPCAARDRSSRPRLGLSSIPGEGDASQRRHLHSAGRLTS